eukprot:PITA_22907
MEERDRIFEGGPCFFATVGLYMQPWTMNFLPERETFTSILIWIRLYSLPLDYWMPESLKAIGALPYEVILEVYDEEWVQIVEYEHIPFRCHKFHEQGHLSRDFPLNKREEYLHTSKGKDQIGFTKVGGKGKGGGRKTQKNHTENDKKTRSYNSFEILGEKEVDGGDQKSTENQAVRGKGKETNMEFTQEQNEHKMDPLSTMEIERDHEMTQSESGTEDQDLQEILESENLELEKFLEQGGNLGINSIPREDVDKASRRHLSLIIQPVGDRQCYMITKVYGPQSMEDKLQLVTTLEDLKKRYPSLPWILGGDFNMTKSLTEKKGGTRTLGRYFVAFQNFLTDMKLVDMETSNGIFTWNNKRGGSTQVASKLDRFIISEELLLMGSSLTVFILPFGGLDHWPIQLEASLCGKPRNISFRFENAWLTHSYFLTNIEKW